MIFTVTIENIARAGAIRSALASETGRLATGSRSPGWQEAARCDAYLGWIATWAEDGEVFYPALRLGLLYGAEPETPFQFNVGGDVVPERSLRRLAEITRSPVRVVSREGLDRRFVPTRGGHLRLVVDAPTAAVEEIEHPTNLTAFPGA